MEKLTIRFIEIKSTQEIDRNIRIGHYLTPHELHEEFKNLKSYFSISSKNRGLDKGSFKFKSNEGSIFEAYYQKVITDNPEKAFQVLASMEFKSVQEFLKSKKFTKLMKFGTI